MSKPKIIAVYSRLPNSQVYHGYAADVREGDKAKDKANGAPGEVPRIVSSVTIKGGADIANYKTLITPMGVKTLVDEDELNLLNANPVFKLHKEGGWVFAEKDQGAVDVDARVAEVLEVGKSDASAPLTEAKPTKITGNTAKVHKPKE